MSYKKINLLLMGLLIAIPAIGGEPKLPAAEMKVIYKAAGLTERNGEILDACNQAVQPKTEVVDLNGDGGPEIFVTVASRCYGNTGTNLSLLIKNRQSEWKDNFGFPGIHKVLNTKNKGYPDIEIGGPGLCFPIYRWNGNEYAIHKRCDR
jgi:hypothetical protein